MCWGTTVVNKLVALCFQMSTRRPAQTQREQVRILVTHALCPYQNLLSPHVVNLSSATCVSIFTIALLYALHHHRIPSPPVVTIVPTSPPHPAPRHRRDGSRLGRSRREVIHPDIDARPTRVPPRTVAAIQGHARTPQDKRHEPARRARGAAESRTVTAETVIVIVCMWGGVYVCARVMCLFCDRLYRIRPLSSDSFRACRISSARPDAAQQASKGAVPWSCMYTLKDSSCMELQV